MITVTRRIVLKYPDKATYLLDRSGWLLPIGGAGRFGPTKQWFQEILIEENGD